MSLTLASMTGQLGLHSTTSHRRTRLESSMAIEPATSAQGPAPLSAKTIVVSVPNTVDETSIAAAAPNLKCRRRSAACCHG